MPNIGGMEKIGFLAFLTGEQCCITLSKAAGFLIFLSFFGLFSYATAAPLPLLSVAFYYGSDPPLGQMQMFSMVVVEPSHIYNAHNVILASKKRNQDLFAYVSLGEVHTSRPYYPYIPQDSLRLQNSTWGSTAIDQRTIAWREFFLSHVIAPLWAQGWRGFFIDTLDSYQLFVKLDNERFDQRQGQIATIRELKRRFPQAKLILNRGFELLPDLASITYAVAAESLYRRYDASMNQYAPVPANDHIWLLEQMKIVRDWYGLPVISIDYVDPSDLDLCEIVRDTAKKVRADGFIPWITDGAIASTMQLRCAL